jgi:hypothetical protein
MTRIQTLIVWAAVTGAALLGLWDQVAHAQYPPWYAGAGGSMYGGGAQLDNRPGLPIPPAAPLAYDPFFAKPRWGPQSWQTDGNGVVRPEPPLAYDPFFAKPRWGPRSW